jgi:hypothetical protein
MADVLSGAVNPSGKLTVTFPDKLTDSSIYDNFPVDVTYDWSYAIHGFLGRKGLPENEPVVKNVHYTIGSEITLQNKQ